MKDKLLILTASLFMAAPMAFGEEPSPAPQAASEAQQKEIVRLLPLIGVRKVEKKQTNKYSDLIAQHKADRESPLGEVFPNAQKLVEQGDAAIMPLARHWTTIADFTSDEYLATRRALTLLLSGKNLHDFYEKIAQEAADESDKEAFLKMAKKLETSSN